MPAKKRPDDSGMKARFSELSDRVATLENNLRRTQERVQSDIQKIIDHLDKKG